MMLIQVVSLGTLKFGKPHKFSLLLKNDGREPVEVKKISVGCTSCTKASIAKTIIGATEEGEVDVVFTPGTLGKQRKSISVLYGDNILKMEFIADVEN